MRRACSETSALNLLSALSDQLFFLHGNVLLSNRNVKIARVVAFLLSSESHAGAIELSWISNAMVNDKAQIMESSCKR